MGKKKRSRGGLDHLIDVTPPARAIGVLHGKSETDPDAEYAAFRTVRGNKIRLGTFAKLWVHDTKMDPPDYETEVLVVKIYNNPASAQPSPYEIKVDFIHTIKRSQVIAAAHDLLSGSHKLPYISDPTCGCENDVVYLCNWPGSATFDKMRDPANLIWLTAADTPMPGCQMRYLAGFAQITGSKSKSDQKIRRHVRSGEGGLSELLESNIVPDYIYDMIPDPNDYYIPTAVNVLSVTGPASPAMLSIPRNSSFRVERGDAIAPSPGCPCLGTMGFDEGQSHTVGFNPTSSQLELVLPTMWFEVSGKYAGGSKRPDPPTDGKQYARTTQSP